MFGSTGKKRDSDTDGLLQRLRNGLGRTRVGLLAGLNDLFSARQTPEPEQMEEIESRLLMADLGIEATTRIMTALAEKARGKSLVEFTDIVACLRDEMIQILSRVQLPIEETFVIKKPFVVLVVGVNGVGKTTTIGKLARYFTRSGDKVVLAAGDTFRAAAIEQIQSWAARNELPVIAQQIGSDSAAVIYDALQSARAKNTDIVIADTAGRLHNKDNLMEELKKIRRTITKFDSELDVEVLLVVDAGTGQNAISQVRLFHEAIGVSGLVLTKLDGTAKGGIVFQLAQNFDIPVRFIGVGEQIDDLRPFDAVHFVDALLDIKA